MPLLTGIQKTNNKKGYARGMKRNTLIYVTNAEFYRRHSNCIQFQELMKLLLKEINEMKSNRRLFVSAYVIQAKIK